MNDKTASHLTELFKRSAPITHDGERSWEHPYLGWEHIKRIILPIQDRNMVAAQAAEIRAAAAERREASAYACGIGHKAPHEAEWHPYGGFALILLDMCRDQIAAAIAADNAQRTAEYEAYRLACEQGVAVPPA